MAAAAPIRRQVRLFLCGDVMTGRGVDQVLPHPGNPLLHEGVCRSALDYVELAQRKNGPVLRPVGYSELWGDAFVELGREAPAVKFINLETAVTRNGEFDKQKAVHYRMSPANIECLTAAGIDGCSLANNHVLDWGRVGLLETLEALETAGIRTAGAGRNRDAAVRPAIFNLRDEGRLLFFGCGSPSAGIPYDWAAGSNTSGVWLVEEDAPASVDEIAVAVRRAKRPNDVVIVSIHWGSNWGYRIPGQQRGMAHDLIDRAGVDLIHGHSSHHVRGIEVYKNHLILYGCGDFLTDYEGIGAHEAFRGDLGLMYFVTMDSRTGRLSELAMVPMQPRRFRLTRPSASDVNWLTEVLRREGQPFGTSVTHDPGNRLNLVW